MSTADLRESAASNPVRRFTGLLRNNFNDNNVNLAIFFGSACLLFVDLVRYSVLNPRYQVAFTDGFEAVIAAAGAIACVVAARRSRKLTHALWATVAVYLALNVIADTHDLLIDLGWQRARVHPLESIGWCVYLPLALLIFFPLAEEGHVRWKWLPIIDFTQVGIAIGIAYFRYIYLHHLQSGQNWTEFGFPEYVRNVLIASGLLLRSRFEPFAPAKRIYRVVGGVFTAITISKALMPAYDAIPPVLVRHMAMLCLGVFAAAWNGGIVGVAAGKRRREIRGLLTIFAATTFAAVIMIADDGPVAYDGIIDTFAGISLLLFVARTIVADRERNSAKKSLRERDEQLRAMFNHQVAGMAITSPDKQWLQVNDTLCRMLNYPREELVNLEWTSLLHPDDRPALVEAFHLMLKGELEHISSENRLLRKDGSVLHAEVSASCIRRPDGFPDCFAVLATDITQRKLAEAALIESEDRYHDLIEHSEDLVCTHDLEGQLLSSNSAPARWLGYHLNEFLNIPIREHITSDFRLQFDAYLERIKACGTDKGMLSVLTKDGQRRVWEYNCTLRTEGVAAPIVRVMAHDVTERVKSEGERRKALQALSNSEERFRVALKDSPITVFNQDCGLRYTWVYNSQIYKQDEVLGKTDVELMGARAAANLTALKQKVLKTGEPAREEVSIPKNGTTYYFETMIEPLRDGKGTIVGITGASMDIARLRLLVDRLQGARDKLAQEKSYLEGEIEADLGFEEIIGQSSILREGLNAARTVAPTDSTVLILGETGTGKELVARSIHALSSRKNRTFVKLNCAAVPSGLLESELFGHEKGAYTSAVSQKVGRIELADKGTLFLDEIGELPLELQPKLLRVLQDREFERLGGIHTIHVDVRIIAATNRDLQLDVAEKHFRDDLFYRLSVFPIHLPPLRERHGDVPMLVRTFVHKHSSRMGKHIEIIPDETMRILERWNWPGNIRELENAIERMVIMSQGSELAPPPAELEHPEDSSFDSLTEMERDHIIRVLRETNGVISGHEGAANRLGLKRTTLQSMLKRFNIQANEYRRGTYH
jgi:PAS domain S-box-containing protein